MLTDSKTKAYTAVLVAAILMVVVIYFVTRSPESESPPLAAVEGRAADSETVTDPEVASVANPDADPAVRRGPPEDEPSAESPTDIPTIAASSVLRVILEGMTEEDAQSTTITVTGVDHHRKWPSHIRDSWPGQGLTSELDLDPFFKSVAEHLEDLHVDELQIEVDHPRYLIKWARVALSSGVELASGQTVYSVRVRMAPPEFWPELTLSVLDADTRAHLHDVELSTVTTRYTGIPRQPARHGAFTSLGVGLSSPISLMGGHEADDPALTVAGIAVRPGAGESPELFDLWHQGRVGPGGANIVYARAPGYAWGAVAIDVSKDTEHELLLGPAATLDVQLANVQLATYEALESGATLIVHQANPGGGWGTVWFQRLDETVATEGLRVESIEPGELNVEVKLGGRFSYTKQPVLASEKLSIAAGETRRLVLALADPPAPQVRATLAGIVAFPAFGGEEKVKLQFYETARYEHGVRYRPRAGVELSLDDMVPGRGALPTWSFRLDDLPMGLYQVQLEPFLKNWMIELPAGGRQDVKLEIPELAEVLVETVDGVTGELIPIDALWYRDEEVLAGRVQVDRAQADLEKPGRFRFWTAPGAAQIYPWTFPEGLHYSRTYKDLELVPGLQSVRLELWPVCGIRFDLREGGAALPLDDGIWRELSRAVVRNIRAVGHDGNVTGGNPAERRVEVSAPGRYEVSFDGLGADRFHPIPPQRVDVRAGETADVIVELRRK